ncbi:Ureidoglycolate lyase [Variovorax sp. SRS16]|uniref:fumarylacetoacetate hydrolase family protein n=1 Tax=Variovorax sp. SRS16 TaxID=282217 RepID=UPI0013194B23|nr:fumarylacetoacetate hydrolase family protein [Variovorax sp. SRS16]VTU32879.1 Ureidoglycolate lyase [Variovorax sp. SRS16]
MTRKNFNLGRFRFDGQILIGRIDGGDVEVVCDGDELPLALSPEGQELPAKRRIPVDAVEMLPPLHPAGRVFAIAINYSAHGAEAKAAPPERPLIFYKAPSNFVAHGGTLNPNKAITSKLDYEGEIAVVIGKPCKDASLDTALSFVAGVCALNDGSARDLGKIAIGTPGPDATYWPDWTANKGLDGASALGPTITCGPEVLGALRERELTITTRLNGAVVQSASMKEMIFSTEQIIATLSSYMTLLPGDVIATGTPAGVGMARSRFLRTGDELEIQVGTLEALSVKVG